MSTRTELLKECAITYFNAGDTRGHDAIMAAIDDESSAYNTYPDRSSDITKALKYMKQELQSSGHSG